MSKKQKLRQVNEEIFSAKHFFAKNIKRYALIIVIAMPIAMVINFILGKNFAWYTGAVSFFCALAMILLACLIGLVIFVKKDEKEKRESTKEKERDPFAD